MREAKLIAIAFYVECPYCPERQKNPDRDSYVWYAGRIPKGTSKKAKCRACGKKYRIRNRKVLTVSKVSATIET